VQKRFSVFVQPILTAIALLGAAVSVWILITGGTRLSVFGVDVRATDPYRPLVIAVIAIAIRIVLGGAASLRSDLAPFRRALTPRTLTIVLVVLAVLAGLMQGSDIGGGADSYGYISQADLWLKGNLIITQPDAAKVPWPDGQSTFAPLGYRASPSGEAIVPLYAAGFPLALAVFKTIGGQCAVGWAVPIAAGVLIAVTFAIGRKTVSDEVGVAAAWLMATSPVFLYSLMSPMSDVPAAALWGLAVYACLSGSPAGALLGGVAAAMAVLVRPNLVHVGLVMAMWIIVRDFRLAAGWRRFARVVLFALPFAAGSLVVAAINHHLYGSATSSGYGRLSGLFSASSVSRNVLNYTWWTVETQTPLALIGLLAICVPLSRLMKSHVEIQGRSLLALLSMSVIITYLFYANFDGWWFLRFLLPMWAALCVGTAHLLTGRSGRSFTSAGIAILLCSGVYGVWYARDAGAFAIGRNEQRYVKIAQLVRDTTEPNSVIITLQHSGSVRYYGARTTLRYEALPEPWLDRTIAWLHDNGFHPYILLDTPEHDPFRTRFLRNTAANLDMAIVFEYRDRYNMSTFLYDPLQPSKLSSMPILVAAPRRDTTRDCALPASTQPVFAMEHAAR
jgi:hypothetical protein